MAFTAAAVASDFAVKCLSRFCFVVIIAPSARCTQKMYRCSINASTVFHIARLSSEIKLHVRSQ